MRNPILKIEEKLQILDQTRFDASKSFVTRGDTAISNVEVRAGADGSFVTVYDADDSAQWYLDWVWDAFKIDIDATNNKIYFKRISDDTTYTATISSGTYTLAALKTEIDTQLNAASAVVWTSTLSTKNELVLTASESVRLLPETVPANLLPTLGFFQDVTDLEFEGEIIEWLTRKVSVRVTNGLAGNDVKDFYQKVFSVEGDALFSNDSDLQQHEPDILDWVKPGRNSFLNAHRASQKKILDWIDQNGYTTATGKKITKWLLLDIEEVRLWSVYMTLHHLFMGFQNAESDVFKEKADYYEKLMINARNKVVLKIDYNEDGEEQAGETINTWSGGLQHK